MPKISTPVDVKKYEVTVDVAETRQLIMNAAAAELNRGHMPGNFKPVLVSGDGFGGFKVLFIQVDDKKFKEVEPLDF